MGTKVMISLTEEFLSEVDRVALQEHRSRSELVREALRLYMGLREEAGRAGASLRVRRAVAMQDHLGRLAPRTGEDSTVDIRRWREARR